jgi:predicted transcriptional regulator
MKQPRTLKRRKIKTIRAIIARGEKAVRAGRVMPHEAAKKRLARWLN